MHCRAGRCPTFCSASWYLFEEKKELPWLGPYNGPRTEADRAQTNPVRAEQKATEQTKFLCKLVPCQDNSEQRLILQSLIFLSD